MVAPSVAWRDADRHLAVQIVAVALEDRMRAHPHLDVQIAGRRAGGAGFALAGKADAIAAVDTRRDAHRQRARVLDAALATAASCRAFRSRARSRRNADTAAAPRRCRSACAPGRDRGRCRRWRCGRPRSRCPCRRCRRPRSAPRSGARSRTPRPRDRDRADSAGPQPRAARPRPPMPKMSPNRSPKMSPTSPKPAAPARPAPPSKAAWPWRS